VGHRSQSTAKPRFSRNVADKGKARSPFEFGCQGLGGDPVTAPKGGQFVLHAKALHGNPFDVVLAKQLSLIRGPGALKFR
jgi:hypothetical protein